MNRSHPFGRKFTGLFSAVALTAGLAAQTSSTPAAPAEDNVVVLSPFAVSASKDKGYLASNSVSGSRFDTPIKYLPFALQAFTEDFIKDQKPVNIFDIAIYSPGVTYRSNDFTEGNVNVAIRGYAAGIILRDGFRGPTVMDFTNISRVEIVKGPASFLYGQLAPGGMVNIITKAPKEKLETTAGVSYGSYNQFRADLDVTGPITKGLLYRVAASYTHDIEYWKPYNAHQSDFAPQFLWRLNERATLAVKFERFQKQETPQVMQKPGWGYSNGIVPTATDPNYSGVDVPGLPEDWNSMAYTDWRRSFDSGVTTTLDVKANDHWDLRASYAFDKNSVGQVFSGNLGVTNGSYFQGRRWRTQTYRNISNIFEAQAIGNYQLGSMSMRLLLGAQYNPYKFRNTAGQMANSTSPAYSPASPLPPWDLTNPATWDRTIPSNFSIPAATTNMTNALTNSTDSAYYGGATLGFFKDRLLVLGGLRETTSVTQTINYLNNTVGQEFTTSRVTPQVGALFKVVPSLSAFATYSESFVPNARVLSGVDKTTAAWTQYVIGPAAPTLGEGYDLGFKADFFSGRVSGTLSYFNVEQTNIINDISEFNGATGTQFFTNLQSGKQRSRGVEIDVTLSPTDNWQIYASASFMDAENVYLFTEAQDAFYLGVADYNTLDAAGKANYKNVIRYHGKPLQDSAPRQYNLWTRYNFTGDLKGLFIGGGANYLGDQTLLPDAPVSAHQTYTIWNALIGYSTRVAGRPTTFELNGKNLGDEYYRPSQSTRSRPREVIFSVTTTF